MAAKTDRIEARLAPAERHRIERAAALAGQSLSSFVIDAAVDRADELIAAEAATVVPSDYFDALLAALDASAEPSPRLEATAKRAHRRRRITRA